MKAGEPLTRHIGNYKSYTIKEFAEYWWRRWEAKGKLHFGTKTYRENEIMRFVPEIGIATSDQ